MAQYYRAVNIDLQEYVKPFDYGFGAKLIEHSWLFNPFVGVVVSLLEPGGRWHKSRVVWAGGYMDEGLFLEQINNKRKSDHTLYDCCCEVKRKPPCISPIRPSMIDGPIPGFLVNQTAEVCVKLQMSIGANELVIHPLPILTCSGNGRGGGDYPFDNPHVGTWAGHVISAEYSRPFDCEEIDPALEPDV